MNSNFKLRWFAILGAIGISFVFVQLAVGYPDPCNPGTTYYDDWNCIAIGSITSLGALSKTNEAICVGGGVVAPTNAITPSCSKGLRGHHWWNNCGSGDNYADITYTVTNWWEPSIPGTFTTNGVFNFTNKVRGITTDLYCSTPTATTNVGVYAVTVNPLPSISAQPTSQTVIVGDNITFTVVANGSGLTYQWQFNSTNVTGATGADLTLNNVQTTNAGNYSVIVTTDAGCSITSTTAVLTVQAPPQTGLILWLKADAGITNTSVNRWFDQTTNHYDATQGTVNSRPFLITNALNGRSVVRFYRTNFLNLSNSMMAGVTQAQAFVVLKATEDDPSTDRTLWSFGGRLSDNKHSRYPDANGNIDDDFGSSVRQWVGNPLQSLDQYHVYEVAAQSGSWAAWVNGVLQNQTNVNTVMFTNKPVLGRSTASSGDFLAGDIAELLIFAKVLTDDEQATVRGYLNSKFALITNVPPDPANLAASPISSNQIALAWTSTATNTISFKLERKQGVGGTYQDVVTINPMTMSYIDTGLTAGTQYYYRLLANNLAGNSDYSSEVAATTLSNTVSMPLGNLQLWLKADAGVVRDNANRVSSWQDQSANLNNARQSSTGLRPLWVDEVCNSKPVIRFDTSRYIDFPNFLSTNTEGEVYVVVKTVTNLPSGGRGLWWFGEDDQGDFTSTSGNIGENFGRSVTIGSCGIPAQRVDAFHLYNVASSDGDWASRVNGRIHYVTTANTPAFTSSPRLGRNGSTQQGRNNFDGDVAEMLIFDRVLMPEERDVVGAYLNQKYALITNAPTLPVGLTAQAIATNQVSLTWMNNLGNETTIYTVERKTGSNGTYSVITDVRDATCYMDGNVETSTTYYYRLKAKNYTGESGYSLEASTITPSSGTGLPLADLKLWLKADAGVIRNNTNGTVKTWLDQSGNTNDATTGGQPDWINGGFNGRPVLRFDTTRYLNLPNFLTSFTEAEAFIVVKAATNLPSGTRGLWMIGTPIPFTGGDYPAVGGNISDGFGRTTIQSMGAPIQRVDSWHLYNVGTKVGEWISRINGAVQLATNNPTVAFATGPYLGESYNGSGKRFDGDIAEVLVFARVLDTEERSSVGIYLNGKYAFLQSPTGAVQLSAQTLSPSQIALSWRQEGVTNYSFWTYTIERRLGTNGVFQSIAQIAGDTRFFDQGLMASTTYSYRVRIAFDAGADYSNELQPTTFQDGADFPLANVALWLRAQDVAATNGGSIDSWPDFSKPSLKAVQTNSSLRPLFATNAMNGQSTVRFTGGKYFELPTVISNAAAAEIFVVLKAATNAPATNQGLWRFNTNGTTWFPATNGLVQDAFGSTNSRISVAPLPDLTLPCVYSVSAATNFWQSRLNGQLKQTLATNTVRFTGISWLGRSTNGGAEPFAGDIGELIIFNCTLSLAEQKTVRDCLAQKFGVVLELPHAPANLTITLTNSFDTLMSWTALVGSENGFESFFIVERQADTNLPYVQLQALERTATNFLDTSGLPEVGHTYRLRVVNDVGEAASQSLSVSLVDTDGDGLPDYLELLLGTNPNSTDTDGDGLPDWWEIKYGLDPLRSDGRHGAAGDFDNDGISNLQEYLQGNNPADGLVGDDPLIRLKVYRPN